MTGSPKVLLVDDEAEVRRSTVQMLELADLGVRDFASAEEVLPHLSRQLNGVLVTDVRMKGRSGMDLLAKAQELDPGLPVIIITGHGDVPLAVEAMRHGAYDFIEKPFSSTRFLETVRRAIEKRELTLELRHLRDTVATRWDNLEAQLIGRSQIMLDLRNQIRMVAPAQTNVLITGDTGTGKELVARAIHDLSGEHERPFVVINCAAIPADMSESELFGHEAGAFPGAARARFGKFELGRNGTIFFDGIQHLLPDVQAKLVRVIEENRVTRLGSNDPIDLNARFIASSETDLESAVDAARFRRDLLYQLSVVHLRLPSLADRAEDIPAMFLMLVSDAANRHGRPVPDISQAYLGRLATRKWPGNVRQLRNIAERLVLGIESDTLSGGEDETLLADRMAAFEKQVIAAELAANGGHLKPVYEALGLSRKTLYEKMQKHGLDRSRFR